MAGAALTLDPADGRTLTLAVNPAARTSDGLRVDLEDAADGPAGSAE